MRKPVCAFLAAALALSIAACAGFDPAKMKEDPSYYYGVGLGRSKTDAKNKARDALITNAIAEAGGKFTRKEKALVEGTKDKLDNSFEVTTEVIRTFELPEIEPFYQDKRGPDYLVVYRFARAEWAKVQKRREERLRAELVKTYDDVIANPSRTIEDRIVEAGRLVDRLAKEGVSDRLTLAATDQTLLANQAGKAARDLAGDIVIGVKPEKGLVGGDRPFAVSCLLKSGKPAASIPLRAVWTAGTAVRNMTLLVDKDGQAQLQFPFATEADFRDRSMGLALSTDFSARASGSPLVGDIDRASIVQLRFRHVSNFNDFLSDTAVVPAGPFIAGAPARDRRAEASEAPRQVQLPAYAIGRHEVTNALYAVYLDDRSVPRAAYPEYWDNADYNKPDQSVIGVTWNDANAFAEWLSDVSGSRMRLPSEDEWEKAARAGSDWIYPWGDESPKPGNRANFSGNNRFDTVAPVGSYATGKNAYGLNDMAGNVAEWTSSPPDSAMKDEGAWRVVKGGSWTDGPADLRISRREALDPSKRYFDVGFRLVKEIPDE